MFLVLLTYKKPIEDVEAYLEEHVAFLDKYYALNKFVCSGRRNPRTGGIILVNHVTKAEIAEIIEEDPFKKYDIADYQIIEFIPTRYDSRFEVFVNG